MDATRARRTHDQARQVWYAAHRQRRFARFMGVIEDDKEQGRTPDRRTHGVRVAMDTVGEFTTL